MFVTDKILKNDTITHGFFGRRGGVSTGIYDSLNCGMGTNDNSDAVTENRRRVCDAMNVKPENLTTLYQIHSAICITLPSSLNPPSHSWEGGRKGGGRPQADAMVTNVPGIALGILTADCAPALFTGTDKNGHPVIGAAHAGWKGALGGILESTIKAMRDLGADNIKAAIGPCIGPESYEVSPDFMLPFLAQDKANAAFFNKGKFDLPGYSVSRLRRAGIETLATGHDTYALEKAYFSYRRTTHRAEPDYGRQISVIFILE